MTKTFWFPRALAGKLIEISERDRRTLSATTEILLELGLEEYEKQRQSALEDSSDGQ